ncbi:glycosyltransferase family 2 protein [Methylobacterium sp. J-088]|uniref:glycosyltransferase family 2 protein n=1 Tax=Methylobacterium sp. J-088 TaxID=2836664 RepID=UPI001FBAEA7D|nr:glycosyltransferase family 2 protein [Methylobacterium sp. J-088]MCJ2066315.1 glycosyltransferase family 2 protein [Methylobacterium sp. J-088]
MKHYLEHGIYEGRPPNMLFNFAYYLSYNNKYLKNKFKNNAQVIIDYLKNSAAFENSPHPLFDPKWYLAQNKDVYAFYSQKKLHPYLHFLEHGARERRAPNPMFDTHWYLQNYPEAQDIVKTGAMTAIQHYLLIGGRRGFSPSPSFDARWYLEQNQDVAALAREGLTDALSHYLAVGRAENRSYREHGSSAKIRNLTSSGTVEAWRTYRENPHDVRRYYLLSKAPLISIIIVNLNGEHHLNDLGTSLLQQTYQNFEIIFVDNGSQDSSCHLWRTLIPNSIIIELDRNVGFAEANNIGLRASRGELIALLNNDTTVDQDWLYSLLNTMRHEPNIGAVTSKIRFWVPFISIEFASDAEFSANVSMILNQLAYK